MNDLLQQCRNFCGEHGSRCSSGDTCIQTMHDVPCIGALGDEIERLSTWINVIRGISGGDKYNRNLNIHGLCVDAIAGEQPPKWWVKHLRGDHDNPPALPVDFPSTPMSVLHPWVEQLTLMQQAVLMTAVRGPDGIRKDHPVKVLLRYFRRCTLVRAFERDVCFDPSAPGGGSFTGPLLEGDIREYIKIYLSHIDELPHHFQLHLMHAAEIVGYCCPDVRAREFWHEFYLAIVKDAHLAAETKEQMMIRLGDNEADWRAGEVVIAKGTGTSMERGA